MQKFKPIKLPPWSDLRSGHKILKKNSQKCINKTINSEHLKTQEMCDKAVLMGLYALRYVLDDLKTQEMCNQAVRNNPAVSFLVPDCFKTQELCIKAIEVDPWQLNNISDYLKTQRICVDAVRDYPSSLQFVPDWFVERGPIDVWYDDDYWYNDDELIEWYESYQKRKAQKAKIKEELLPIA